MPPHCRHNHWLLGLNRLDDGTRYRALGVDVRHIVQSAPIRKVRVRLDRVAAAQNVAAHIFAGGVGRAVCQYTDENRDEAEYAQALRRRILTPLSLWLVIGLLFLGLHSSSQC